jgi:hypothetical protein
LVIYGEIVTLWGYYLVFVGLFIAINGYDGVVVVMEKIGSKGCYMGMLWVL